MFNYNQMIQRAIEFFPLWTDIRKRKDKSNGGQLISSIIEEEIKIEETIQEYIDSYFLYNYIGHEDEVMAFSYRIHTGLLDSLNNIKYYYNDLYYPFVDNLKDFEEIDMRVFYEEGYIYMNFNNYIEGLDHATLYIDDVNSDYKLEKIHVWNIFDEFATFMNLKRHEDETNKELLDRILYTAKNLPNSTEAGLKHAIIS